MEYDSSKRKYKNFSRIIKDGGFINCGKDIYKKDGFIGFWRGFSACSTRAIYANAIGFMAYEKAREYFYSESD